MSWTLQQIAAATGGEILSGERDLALAGVGIDSRRIAAGEAFVAIRGAAHDGHDFVAAAIARGARAVVVERRAAAALASASPASTQAAWVAVADTTRALGDLAAFHRRRMPAAVVAVTGSNGKTTTRRMTAMVLAARGPILEPERNFNNQIGVPLTLFRLRETHRAAVLELGTSLPGEIARLAAICRPEVGVITNIGPAHLEGLGSLDGVRREKSALFSGLAPGGRAVLNRDDPLLRGLVPANAAETLWFGLDRRADVRAEDLTATPAGLAFRLILPGEPPTPVRLQAHGRFMAQNALAAAAVGRLFGLGAEEIRQGLERFTPVAGRMAVEMLGDGVGLVDDSYNANPGSMTAALEALAELGRRGRRILVMGEMRELGAGAPALHRQMGELAARSGVARLFACGPFASEVAAGARAAGMPSEAICCGDREEIARELCAQLAPGDWVLVKGSRAAGMEAVAAALRQRAETRGR